MPPLQRVFREECSETVAPAGWMGESSGRQSEREGRSSWRSRAPPSRERLTFLDGPLRWWRRSRQAYPTPPTQAASIAHPIHGSAHPKPTASASRMERLSQGNPPTSCRIDSHGRVGQYAVVQAPRTFARDGRVSTSKTKQRYLQWAGRGWRYGVLPSPYPQRLILPCPRFGIRLAGYLCLGKRAMGSSYSRLGRLIGRCCE